MNGFVPIIDLEVSNHHQYKLLAYSDKWPDGRLKVKIILQHKNVYLRDLKLVEYDLGKQEEQQPKTSNLSFD